jgi:hypothetical protein
VSSGLFDEAHNALILRVFLINDPLVVCGCRDVCHKQSYLQDGD